MSKDRVSLVAQMAPDTMVSLAGVTVRYRAFAGRRRGTSSELFTRLLRPRPLHSDIWALQNVNVAIKKGEAFGIIGSNGSGKSTLLKVIARVLKPAAGRVMVRGLVAPLIELGVGFDMELTGRENIYLKSAIMGYSRPCALDRVERVTEFAGLEDFIEAPLRTYSSGMLARLAFAVAIDVQPDILLVDEVLSVGDVDFQERSTRRMDELRRAGTTVMIVSHSPTVIKSLCGRALWLSYGRAQMVGHASEVVEAYEGTRPASPPEERSAHRASSAALDGYGQRPLLTLTMDGPTCGSGWYSKEHHPHLGTFRWSGPHTRSTLHFAPPPWHETRGTLLRFHTLATTPPHVIDRLKVSINDVGVSFSTSVWRDGCYTLQCRVPAGLFSRRGTAEISFDVGATETLVPASIGYIETRRVGIAIGAVEISPDLEMRQDSLIDQHTDGAAETAGTPQAR